MRHVRWLVLALLLSGCTAPAPASELRHVPFRPDAAATPFDACAGNCSQEWWNLSVQAPGAVALRVPLPVVPLRWGEWGVWRDPLDWGVGLQASEGARARVLVREEQAFLEVSGTGPLEVRAHRVREAGPSGVAEDFVLARWGPEANQTRPQALEVSLTGPLASMTLRYEAVGGLCVRGAHYEAGAHDSSTLWMTGTDEVVCR